MGASWVALGRLLEALGRLLGTSWAPLGASWVPSGASWGPLGTIKASNSSPRPPRRPPRGLQEAPKSSQQAPKEPPRGPQEAPERSPRCPKSSQEVSKMHPLATCFFVLDREGLPISYPRFWKSKIDQSRHYVTSANLRALRCQRKL